MKKSILATVLLSGLALSAFATTSVAAQIEKSEVEVILKEDTGSDNGSGPYKDKLSIIHKPTIFQFSGDVTDGSLNLANEHINSDSQFIAVNDDRKDAEGKFILGDWKLEGELSEITSGTTVLPAKMVFTPSSLLEYNIGDLIVKDDGSEDYKPNNVDKTANPADSAKYDLTGFTLETNGPAQKFLTSAASPADVDQSTVRGVATNLGDVRLLIATGDAGEAGTYTGEITWTLSPGS